MAEEIRFELTENVSAALRRGREAGVDLTPAMMSIANRLDTLARLRFEREQAPDGSRWKPSQRAIDDGGQTLSLSGDLKNSIRPAWDRTTAAAGPEKSFGAAIYAAIHQFGGVIVPKVKKALSFGGRMVSRVVMPVRAYLGFEDADREAIPAIIVEHLASAFDGRGGGAL